MLSWGHATMQSPSPAAGSTITGLNTWLVGPQNSVTKSPLAIGSNTTEVGPQNTVSSRGVIQVGAAIGEQPAIGFDAMLIIYNEKKVPPGPPGVRV
jgi:hypothetical protein